MKQTNEQRKLARRQRITDIYQKLTRIFIVILAFTLLANFIKRDSEFSASENRVLAQRPKMTWESVKSGKFMKEYEAYVSDQFFLRDQWIQLKFMEDRALGKKESNGVYLGKSGYLMEVPGEPDWSSVEKNIKAINEFAQRHTDIPVYMTLVPNASYILKDKMPANAPAQDQEKDIKKAASMLGEKIAFLDVTKTLQKNAGKDIYYKTDHHWTSLGAFYAFQSIAEDMGIKRPAADDYKIHTVANNFQGTLSSKSGYHGSKDSIEVYELKDSNVDYTVLYVEEGKKSTSVYESGCLKEKDKYTVFFGGNHARVDINTTVEERKNLLLFKDSYANCFVPFLLPYYQSITIVDPRYFYENIDSIVENNGITDILFLYNVNTFLNDNSIADVLAAG